MSAFLSLLGAPTIALGGAARALPFERRTQLLVFLALKRSWVGRAEIAALLWPEQEAKLAHANLRKALHRLQSLPDADAIEVQGSALRLEAETDAAAFELALREQRVADALAVWRGDLLHGFDDPANAAWTDWLGFERDRLRAAWRGAAQRHLAGDVDPGAAVDLAARLLEADPLDEDALRHYMHWLARAGQTARARQAYREFVDRLQQELGLAPSANLVTLLDSLAAAGPMAKEAVAAPKSEAGDGFVGRAVELRRIAALLSQGDCRLLSLTGPGGVGKTRLARRVVDQLSGQFDDGGVFVPLDDLTSAGELGGRLAHELGLALNSRGDPLEQVIETLRPRHKLLVLDNFEHLADGVPLLERLLARCPRVKVVVTSRVRLALAQEWLLPVEGLPCPDDEDLDHVESFDAARLFVRAALRVRPHFAAAGEAAAIVDICRQVEGLPLALELAAGWTRVLSCDAIAKELRQGTELLHAADATPPARHAGIDVVFEQSWRMLTDVERDVLARLSVFSGGFTPEAARAVTGARIPVLAALIDKSLVRKEDTRLRLHPLVQQFSGARLGTGEARDAAQSAHAAYFHQLLHQLRPGTVGADSEALRTIDAEFDNCRQAWRFALASSDVQALTGSLPTLASYIEDRARFAEGLELLREAVESRLCESNEALRALVLSQQALLELRTANYAEADDKASCALAMRLGDADHETRFRALAVRAGCAVNTGRLDAARSFYAEALALARAAGSPSDAAATLENLSLVEKRLGNYDEALRLSVEALAQHRRNGDRARIALCLSNLGSFYMFLNRNDLAASHLQEALALSERHGLVSTRGFVLANLTELALKARDGAQARLHAQRALEVAESTGMRALAGWLKLQLARLAAWRGDRDEAHRLLCAGAELAQALAAPSLKAALMLAFAELLEATGEQASAQGVLAFAKDQPSLSVPDREELRVEWARRGETPLPSAGWPGLTLDELIGRIAAEADRNHAPLIASLRAAG